jgi:flagellar hook-associated protein 3 FlgL
LNEHLATGKSVNRPSDDPTGFDVARAMDQAIARHDQYLRTINSSRLWVDETESALNRIAEHLVSVQEAGLRAANDTMSADDREAIATQLEGLLETIVDELNSKAGGEYVFGGTKSTDPPFALDGGPGSDSSGLSYSGNNGARRRTIGDGLSVSINLTGADVITQASGATITESLNDLIVAIRSGDSDQIEAGLAGAAAARDHAIQLVAESAGTSQRMSFAEEQLRESMIHMESRRSYAEDADITETLTNLQRHQLGLQAATQALIAIRQLDITNFL